MTGAQGFFAQKTRSWKAGRLRSSHFVFVKVLTGQLWKLNKMIAIYFQAFDAGCAPFFMILFALLLLFGLPVTLLFKFMTKPERDERSENPLSINKK